MAKKKLNKFVVPQEYNQSVVFAKGGNLYTTGGLPTNFKESAAGQFASGDFGAGMSGALGAVPGVIGLMNSTMKDFDMSGIGKEVVGTNDMSRNDILNTNVNVDTQQKGVGAIAGDAASAAMAGMQVAGPWGALAGLVPIATGIFGNSQKEQKAKQDEQQWTNNLQAKNRQFQQQDLRTSMANFSANGGDLFAYGGQMPQQLTEFNTSGTHEQNPNGGIMQGTGANGQPNLVEQGETKHEDYIFSDRLKVNPTITKQFKLPAGLNGKTFAAASKYLNKEAKERPNDPISNNAVKAQLAKLIAAQEGLKQQMQPQQQQGIPMQGQQPMQQNPMQAQQLQQPQVQSQENIMEDGSQQMKYGGYKPRHASTPQHKSQQMMQQIQQMIQQGASQEDVEMQLQKSGMNADQAEQLVMSAMQQMKGKQSQSQSQQQGIPMDGQQFAQGGNVQKQQQQQQMQQVVQAVAQMIQQGLDPQKIVQQLIKMGIPQQAAMQLVQQEEQQFQQQDQSQQQQPQTQNPQQQQGIPSEQPQQMANGGEIHIKKGHEGRFTAYKKRTGKTTTEALHSKDPHVRKMANFARNAAKWHGDGGDLYSNGGELDQTHYQNPTLQGVNIGAMGGNIFADGDFMDMQDKKRSDVFTNIYDQAPYIQKLPIVLNATSPTGSTESKYIQQQNALGNKIAGQDAYVNSFLQSNVSKSNPTDNTTDFSRYAPAAANIAMGISDIFEQPEVVKYGRVNPERNTAHMDYQPIDTEWMNNKMNATYAGTRDQMINNAGGNRAAAMAGLSGINQQQQNAVGESYLKAQDANYQRRNQATQFNAAIEGQNVAAQNAAQQQNLQLQMAELDANARNRAAKRNAARQAILNAAGNIGDIGKENYAAKVAKNVYGYDQYGNFVTQDGKKYDKSGKLIG